MRAVHQSVRLSPAQFQMLVKLAEGQSTSRYSVLSEVIAKGFAAFANERHAHSQIDDIVDEIATMSIRLLQVERLLERALYTSCASYIFARGAAAQRKLGDATATEEILEAFNRQRALAEEQSE